jgi:AraC family transcriptional regulator of adaptative response/methylated-DNA-[protein]-cysteine methyltransferase
MTPGEYRSGGRGVEISYARFETALGPMLIGATDRGICFLQFGASVKDLRGEFPHAAVKETEGPSAQLRQWGEAIASFLQSDLPLAPSGTPFQMQVWDFLRTIPRGETRTYSEVAAGIGRPSAVRAVARACASNRVAVLIPCHRVIRGDGELGGYRWGIGRKRALLAKEADGNRTSSRTGA